MTSHYPSIAQAVVTDPLESAAGGYVLVAKSPGILAQDADFLSASPGISDYLHELEKTDESYYSFFRLPSKKYALVHRFLRDKRRGVNRVVVHLLVLSDELLPTLQENVWLLIADGKHFREIGDAAQTFSLSQLGDEVIKPGVRELPDLSCLLPENNGQSSFESLVDKRNSLLKQWPKKDLRHQLIGILEALVRGKWVLLPQSSDYRDLLAFAWLSLPIGDRRRISWTTHFTPGRVLFRLANAPEPNKARLLYPKRENCLLLKEIDELAAHPHKAVQILCDRLLTETPEELESLYQKLQSYKLSLLNDVKAVDWHLYWWKSEHKFLNFVKNGASTLPELSERLSDYESLLAQSRQPLDGLDMNVLYGICMTGSMLSTPPQLEEKLKALDELITRTHSVEKCLAPTLVTKFLNQGYGSFQTALIAIGLAWRRDENERHRLFSLFYDKYLTQEGLPKNNNDNETLSFLAQMSFELVTAYSGEINQDEPALLTLKATADSTVFDKTLEYLGKNPNPLYAAKALLKIAGQVKKTDIVADIMTEIIFPSVEKDSDNVIIDGLENSQGHPVVISHALKLCSGKAFDRALSQLKALIARKPKEAEKIIGDVLARKSLPNPFYESPEIKDMTRMLDKLGLPIQTLLKFILAEAIWLENNNKYEDFKKSLSRVVEHRSGDEIKYILEKTNKWCYDRPDKDVFRIIFEKIACKAAEVKPKETLYFLTKALTDKNDSILEWGHIVKEIYDIFIQQGKTWADRLGTLWWKTLSHCDSYPTETELKMLDSIGHKDFLEILKEWIPRIPKLIEDPCHVRERFKNKADKKDFVKQNPVIYIEFLASFLASTIRTEQLKLEAVNHLCLVCDELEQPPDIFINKGLLVLFGGRQALIKQIPALFKSEDISFIVRLIFRELALQPKIQYKSNSRKD